MLGKRLEYICLKRIQEVDDVHTKRMLVTEYYLQICANYIDILCSPRHSLRSRIVLAAKVSSSFFACGGCG